MDSHNEHAVDSSEEPEIVKSSTELIVEQKPTIENPVLRLAPYNIVQQEFSERVQVQRMVQEYKPKWGFALLALTGSAVSFLRQIPIILSLRHPQLSNNPQRNGYNARTVLAATNLEEKGDPILTDEIRYLRQTGFDVRTDTLALDTIGDENASITIYHKDEKLLNEPSISVDNGIY